MELHKAELKTCRFYRICIKNTKGKTWCFLSIPYQTNIGGLCSSGASTPRVWLLRADSKCCLAFTEEWEGAQGEEGKSWCWQGGKQPCRKWRCQNRPGIPSSLLCSRIDSFPSPTRTGLGLWQGRMFLTTLNADGGVGKELKLSVCQGMLPHGSYCSSVKFTKQLLTCVLQVPQMLNLILLKIRAVQLREDLFCSGFCFIEKWVSIFFHVLTCSPFPFQAQKAEGAGEAKWNVWIFDNCVLLVTVQFEILFFIKFYNNAEFWFTFF